MDTWTKQAGYPIIYVNTNQNRIELKQERFYKDSSYKKKNE
jgi:aminopeptidase N